MPRNLRQRRQRTMPPLLIPGVVYDDLCLKTRPPLVYIFNVKLPQWILNTVRSYVGVSITTRHRGLCLSVPGMRAMLVTEDSGDRPDPTGCGCDRSDA